MAIQDRRERERAARRRLIVTTARTLAEADGWDAVTTRRLSTEIEYSQPVLYKHFTGMEQIADAVAIDGFGEIADVMRAARLRAGPDCTRLPRLCPRQPGRLRRDVHPCDHLALRRPRHTACADGGLRRAAPSGRRHRWRAGCGRTHRGVLGRTAWTGHPQPCRPTTPGLRLGPSPTARQSVHQQTRNDALGQALTGSTSPA